mgnify:CR=1 FL=1
MANTDYWHGNFYGKAYIQKQAKIGGAKDVFVKLGGVKNDAVFPTFGGTIMNPFKGTAKLFAGDLAEFRADDKGVKPQYWILKTYEVVSASGTTINIKRDGFKHIPFVGDVIMVAPAKIGGVGIASTVTAVAATTVTVSSATYDVWQLTMADSKLGTPALGKVLVEAVVNPDSTGSSDTHKMAVQRINSVCQCDYDFRFAEVGDPTASDYDFEKASYDVTLPMGGIMYIHKMSPMPQCVLDLNEVNVNGWFGFNFATAGIAHKLALK